MAHKTKSSLAQELSYYESHKDEWVKSHAEKFVLIGDTTVGGFFSSYEEAFESGLKAFGLDREFLIKQVIDHEPVFVIY